MPFNRISLRYLIPAAVFFGAAAIFRFAMVGYGVLSLCFAALGVFCLLLWRSASKGRRFLWGILAVCLAVLVILEIPIIRDTHTSQNPRADYAIVLGAGVQGTLPSRSLTDRLNAALDYLETYPETIAVLSGGQGPGEKISEARCMFDWLTQHGIAPERLLLEDAATSTEENLRFSFALIEKQGGTTERLAIVSSDYHLHRAKILAQDLGCTIPLGVAAKTSLPLLRLNYFLREAGAFLVR